VICRSLGLSGGPGCGGWGVVGGGGGGVGQLSSHVFITCLCLTNTYSAVCPIGP
jgi:hypothetical protein